MNAERTFVSSVSLPSLFRLSSVSLPSLFRLSPVSLPSLFLLLAALSVNVSASFSTEKGEPRVTTSSFQLPMCLAARIVR